LNKYHHKQLKQCGKKEARKEINKLLIDWKMWEAEEKLLSGKKTKK